MSIVTTIWSDGTETREIANTIDGKRMIVYVDPSSKEGDKSVTAIIKNGVIEKIITEK